jgi:two-component system OmpR family response regulator
MISGIDGLTKLREFLQTAATPVLIMTAKVQSHEMTKYMELGAIDVTPKPFDSMAISN